jgi:hypothetical protein
MSRSNDPIKTEYISNENCSVKHIDGVYGTLSPAVGQIAFYYDTPRIRMENNGEMSVESIERALVFDARMSPETFRSIAYWMIDHVKNYENWLLQQTHDNKG